MPKKSKKIVVAIDANVMARWILFKNLLKEPKTRNGRVWRKEIAEKKAKLGIKSMSWH